MLKRCVGIDIGSYALHLVVRDGNRVSTSIVERLPADLVQNGQILSMVAMGDFLKEVRKKHKIHCKDAAIVLPSVLCFCRQCTVPAMSHEQVMVNLPYEFRDFITDEKDRYYYDYYVVDVREGQSLSAGEGEESSAELPQEMELMAAAVPKKVILEYREMLRRAGFKLKIAVPYEVAYCNLVNNKKPDGSYAILDIGHTGIRAFLFEGTKFEAQRFLDTGCGSLDLVISDQLNVDPHVATSYRETNFQDVQSLERCKDIYNSIAIDILKAINYYNFNHPDAPLEKIYCSGGGVQLKPLMDAVAALETLSLRNLSELLHDDVNHEKIAYALAAFGATLQ